MTLPRSFNLTEPSIKNINFKEKMMLFLMIPYDRILCNNDETYSEMSFDRGGAIDSKWCDMPKNAILKMTSRASGVEIGGSGTMIRGPGAKIWGSSVKTRCSQARIWGSGAQNLGLWDQDKGSLRQVFGLQGQDLALLDEDFGLWGQDLGL